MSRFHVVQGSGRNAFLSPRRIRVSCNNQARTVSYNCTPGILCGYIHVKLFEKGRAVPFHTILMLFCYVHLPSQSHGLFHGSLPSLSDTPSTSEDLPCFSLILPIGSRSYRSERIRIETFWEKASMGREGGRVGSTFDFRFATRRNFFLWHRFTSAMARKGSEECVEDRDLIDRSPDWLKMESFWEEEYDVDAYLSDLRTIVSHASVGRMEHTCDGSEAKGKENETKDRRLRF